MGKPGTKVPGRSGKVERVPEGTHEFSRTLFSPRGPWAQAAVANSLSIFRAASLLSRNRNTGCSTR